MARPVARLLIADPDRLQLQLLDMLLASGSYDLTMVESGREALEHLKEHTPDLAILALDLPDVEGDVICGKIRRVTRLARTPVILVSPQSGRLGLSDGVRSRARRAGADLVLPRPLGDKNLAERVGALLDARDATPTREGHTTRILDDALSELAPGGGPASDDAPAHATRPHAGGPSIDGPSVDRPSVDRPSVDAPIDAPPDEAPLEVGPSDARHEPVVPAPERGHDAPYRDGHDDAASHDAASAPEEGYAALQRELETLRLENAQLRRKLAAKSDELQAGPNAELQERIVELERRNRVLNEELEKRGGKGDGRGGGWFGRRG